MTDEELLAHQREKMKEIEAGRVTLREAQGPVDNRVMLIHFRIAEHGRSQCVAPVQTADGPKLIVAEYESFAELPRRAAIRAVTMEWARVALAADLP